MMRKRSLCKITLCRKIKLQKVQYLLLATQSRDRTKTNDDAHTVVESVFLRGPNSQILCCMSIDLHSRNTGRRNYSILFYIHRERGREGVVGCGGYMCVAWHARRSLHLGSQARAFFFYHTRRKPTGSYSVSSHGAVFRAKNREQDFAFPAEKCKILSYPCLDITCQP